MKVCAACVSVCVCVFLACCLTWANLPTLRRLEFQRVTSPPETLPQIWIKKFGHFFFFFSCCLLDFQLLLPTFPRERGKTTRLHGAASRRGLPVKLFGWRSWVSERLGSARPCGDRELGHGEGVDSPRSPGR